MYYISGIGFIAWALGIDASSCLVGWRAHGQSVVSYYRLLQTTNYRLQGSWNDDPQTEVSKFGGTSCHPVRPPA